MAGLIYAPIAFGTFIGGLIISPFIPSASLFGMPALLTLSTIFNFNIDWLNYWYSSAKLTALPWWNILYAVLSMIGILPSFILIPLGFIGIILTIFLAPVLYFLEILSFVAFAIYWYFDPSLLVLSPVLKLVYCLFGASS